MVLFVCCCSWAFVVGRRHVYGPIYAAGIGPFPQQLAETQRMMTRDEWREHYSDCVACHAGGHHHDGD